MTRPEWNGDDESAAFRYWDGERWQNPTAPRRPRHPDFPPPPPHPSRRAAIGTRRLGLAVTSTLSVLATAIGLSLCANSSAHDHAGVLPAGWFFAE